VLRHFDATASTGNLDGGVPRKAYHDEGMKFRIVIEHDVDTHAFSAVCPELPGCASAGDT